MDIEQLKKNSQSVSIPVASAIDDQFIIMATAAPVLLWVSGIDKLCHFFNKYWLDFTGRTLEQESGNGWLNGVHPDDMERCSKIYSEAFDKRKEFKMEYRLLRHDGQYRWILDTGVPNFTKEKKFEGYIGSCVDIHDLKELEQRKNQFINAASHELKTPVTSLNIYLHLISEFLQNNHEEKYAAYAVNAINQVNKITGLIDQLLDLTRIETDSLNLELSVFSFRELVTSIVEKTQSITPTHVIELRGECHGIIKGDSERLSQAIENLLTNAIKYSKNGDKIIVEISENTKNVEVTVIDFGIGIEKKHLSKIFDRFYRIPGNKEETYPGLGIGLYISQQIIKKHGGNIEVESISNKETKFSFQIPIFKETA